MRSWLCLSLYILGTTTLGGCDHRDEEQAQAASRTASAPQPPAPEVPGAKEIASDKEPVARLDDAGNLEVKEIDWDALIPEGWRPDALMDRYNADEISDDDPRAQQLLDKLKALWKEAPIVPTLEGQRVKLPGFVVPLEMDAKKIDQFLLVPYYGACIHVPPPPANQTIHVVTGEGKAFDGQLFDVVWVSGTMRVERLSSDLAEAGYRLEDARVVPYE